MAYDYLALAACLDELKTRAVPAKINKIHQPDKHTLIMRFYGKNGAGRILLCAGADQARLQITEMNPVNPAKAPLFLMVARKWLEGATLKAVRQTPFERVAELEFSTRNDLGDAITLRLICEIMGKHSNIILVDEAGLIIDGIRRYDSRLSRYREVMPGQPYVPPPPLTKAMPPFADEEALANALLQEDLGQSVAAALNRHIGGVSPWLSREIVAGAQLSENLLVDELGQQDVQALLVAVNRLAERVAKAEFTPTLLLKSGKPVDFSAISPALWQGEAQQTFSSMSEVLDAFYEPRSQEQEFNRQKKPMEKALKQHISRLQRKIAQQTTELNASKRGEEYKEAGDLLAAHLYSLHQETGSSGRGLTEVNLPSFEDASQLRRIELDAALTPQQNIQLYYRRYNKCRKARTAIEEHLATAQEEHEYSQSIAQSLAAASHIEELAEIERELRAAGILPKLNSKPGKGGKTEKKQGETALPPRSYISADGFPILVGRNNKQNERLSLKMAAADDIWLHTQKIPGSHVLIVTEGRQVPDTTLTEAASYAAWFSQASASSKVPVDYTRASQVKKPAGSKPGMVIYFQQQTVYVEPKEPTDNE